MRPLGLIVIIGIILGLFIIPSLVIKPKEDKKTTWTIMVSYNDGTTETLIHSRTANGNTWLSLSDGCVSSYGNNFNNLNVVYSKVVSVVCGVRRFKILSTSKTNIKD